MKKGLKITLIVLGVLVVILDTLQAIVFNNSPLLKVRDNLDGGNIDYIDKGLFVNHYHCVNNESVTTWKETKFACSLYEAAMILLSELIEYIALLKVMNMNIFI